ncbi:hypothetical protein BZL54_17370 [Burkholderia ubonensis subsp. mesacidophila]|uniref:Outer membrane assembly lipoprotein YfiO n=1 Tax=Burkholderia ubonensis subsp. mesacidophila TaxID=265293 RepID=A0A2A4FDA6_9BURK|nr:hypothetical protein BZL54_17370 [Burkholderia ubonensis subsp. mesacidophila]
MAAWRPKRAIATLVASLLPAAAAHASGDFGCDPGATLRYDAYTCAGVPFLSPANDTRINAMLLMADSSKLGDVFPNPASVAPADRASRLAVPFSYDFSGWIDIGQKVMTMQLADGAESDAYADGEGGLCRSASSGTRAFNEALSAAKGLPGDDATRLRAARADMVKACAPCANGAGWAKPAGLQSPLGQQFAAYLDGAHAFYASDFADAAEIFGGLRNSADPWLKEAALYMVGRAQLNVAQAQAFGPDNDAMHPDRVDKAALNAADTAFRDYLNAYPHGRYAPSALGLQRRIAWLGGDTARQAAVYDKAFAAWSPAASNVPLGQLANELDSKMLMSLGDDTSRIQSPAVLALVDLMNMRSADMVYWTDRKPKPLTLSELRAQKPRFAAAPALHDYLLATYHVYVDKQPQQALALLPASPGASLDYLALSQQTLRGFALEDTGQPAQARQLWERLIPLAKYPLQREALELALAINLERAGQIAPMFAAGSLIRSPAIRSIVLQHDADADLLRREAQNRSGDAALREIALATLLYKELTRGHYAAFLDDLALVPAKPSDALKAFVQTGGVSDGEYACPSIRDIAATLKRTPGDPKGHNCVAEFVRRHPPVYGDDASSFGRSPADPRLATSKQAPPSLGSAPSQFQGGAYARIDSYRKVIGNAQAPANDRAYALYRAVSCFAPAGYSECGGNDIPTRTRKQWFRTLKAAYPRSQWAQSLQYYW